MFGLQLLGSRSTLSQWGEETFGLTINEFYRQTECNLTVHEYPREIEFLQEPPMTTTGKIMRRELRQREVGRRG
jgi:acetyl-CoA synthetase